MKDLYKSPVITVEELSKVDVLCDSPAEGGGETHNKTKVVFKENVIANIADIL